MAVEQSKIPPLLLSYYAGGSRAHLADTHRHIDGFNSLIKYIISLRREESIDDDVFGELVKKAAAVFVEAEITECVDHALEKKFSTDYILSILK